MADRENVPPSLLNLGMPLRPTIRSASGFGATNFVFFASSIMALNALGIDSMLPALPTIGNALEVAHANDRQWIIAIFMLGFGLAQIVWGPLADHFGRKPLLIIGVTSFAVSNLLAGFASSFSMLLVARLLGGASAAAARIILISVIRDCYSGRQMARIMSLAIMMIYLVPMVAPSLGQVIVVILGSWRAIFFMLAAYAGVVGAFVLIRLKETLRPEFCRPLNFAAVADAFGQVIRDRSAIGYTMASACSFACVSSFVMSVEPIFTDIFRLQDLFPILFAGIGGCMGIAMFINAWFVERFGTRLISHAALIAFIAVNFLHLAVAVNRGETLFSFVVLQGVQMFLYGLMSSNFNSMAMETVGDIAGSASSVQGFISTCIGAGVGAAVGQLFDSTTVPLALGFLGCSLFCLCAVLYAEQGRLFRPHHTDTSHPPI